MDNFFSAVVIKWIILFLRGYPFWNNHQGHFKVTLVYSCIASVCHCCCQRLTPAYQSRHFERCWKKFVGAHIKQRLCQVQSCGMFVPVAATCTNSEAMSHHPDHYVPAPALSLRCGVLEDCRWQVSRSFSHGRIVD